MSRWPTLSKSQEAHASRTVLASVAGTILPGDTPVIGRPALVALARKGSESLSQTRGYAAVNTLAAQPWMVQGLGVPATMVSSAEAWMGDGRAELISTRRGEASRKNGGLPPKPGSRPRGRPRKG